MSSKTKEILQRFSQEKKLTDEEAFLANYQALYPGISREESYKHYNGAGSELYEEYLSLKRFRGPTIAAECTAAFFKEDGRENPLILDFAAGTGFVGQELNRLGLKNLHCLEPARKMLEIARKKKIYSKDFNCFLDHNRLPIDDNTYDCAVSSGGFCEGHIPPEGLHELARIVKPGGLVCIVTRYSYVLEVQEYSERLEPLMAQMEQQGKWRRKRREVVPNYALVGNSEGIVYEFIVC